MPGSPIQEQIRAWIQIGGRKVAYPEKSQIDETSRPTFASSNLRKPPKGGFLFLSAGRSCLLYETSAKKSISRRIRIVIDSQ